MNNHLQKQKIENIKKTKTLLKKNFTIKEISDEIKIGQSTIKKYIKEIEENKNFFEKLLEFWINTFFESKLLFFGLIILVFFLIYGITMIFILYSLMIYIIGRDFIEILQTNLSPIIGSDTVIVGLILIFIWPLIEFIIKIIHHKNNKEINWWTWRTIIWMVFIIFLGLFFINKSTTANFEYGLNDELNSLERVGLDLKCVGESKRLLYNSEYQCNILKPYFNEVVNISNLTSTIKFRSENGDKEINLKDEIKFEVPENTTYVLINIEGSYESKKIHWSSGRYFNFITPEEEEEISKQFLSDLFVLLTLVLFSIPTLAVNFKTLSEKKGKH